jgi:hypothetical protein
VGWFTPRAEARERSGEVPLARRGEPATPWRRGFPSRLRRASAIRMETITASGSQSVGLESRVPNTPHSVLGVICLGIAPGGVTATACLTQLHPPALACAAASPRTALGSYSQLSPITLAGWSSLCCAWPHGGLTPAAAHLAVSVGWFTPRAEARERSGEVPLARRGEPATPGRRGFPSRLRQAPAIRMETIAISRSRT